MSVNRVFLMGNLGRDVSEKHLPSGMNVAETAIATTETYKGEKKTTWHNVKAFGKTAEFLTKYFGKGDQLFIEGKIQNSSYENKDGNKVNKSEVLIDKINFVGKKVDKPENTGENVQDNVPF